MFIFGLFYQKSNLCVFIGIYFLLDRTRNFLHIDKKIIVKIS